MFGQVRDAAINFFDYADVYGGGKSERILGWLVASCRDEVVLTTKVFYPTGPDVNAGGLSRPPCDAGGRGADWRGGSVLSGTP